MEPLPFVTVLMLILVDVSHKFQILPTDHLKDLFSNPIRTVTNIRKRAVPQTDENKDVVKFVEEKLIQHTRALEHLASLAQSNEALTKKLIEKLGDQIKEPEMPMKSELQSRRSLSGPPRRSNEPSPWCAVAVLCDKTVSPVCGFDDKFGYGKFDNLCHMLQVNCYWKYNFVIVANCKPIFYV